MSAQSRTFPQLNTSVGIGPNAPGFIMNSTEWSAWKAAELTRLTNELKHAEARQQAAEERLKTAEKKVEEAASKLAEATASYEQQIAAALSIPGNEAEVSDLTDQRDKVLIALQKDVEDAKVEAKTAKAAIDEIKREIKDVRDQLNDAKAS